MSTLYSYFPGLGLLYEPYFISTHHHRIHMAGVNRATLFQLVALLAVASVRVKVVAHMFLATHPDDLALVTIVHTGKPITVRSKQHSPECK